jgi:hypothetical protein
LRDTQQKNHQSVRLSCNEGTVVPGRLALLTWMPFPFSTNVGTRLDFATPETDATEAIV